MAWLIVDIDGTEYPTRFVGDPTQVMASGGGAETRLERDVPTGLEDAFLMLVAATVEDHEVAILLE